MKGFRTRFEQLPGVEREPSYEREIERLFGASDPQGTAEVTFLWVGRDWGRGLPPWPRPEVVLVGVGAPADLTRRVVAAGVLAWVEWSSRAWMVPLVHAALNRRAAAIGDPLASAIRASRLGQVPSINAMVETIRTTASGLGAEGALVHIEDAGGRDQSWPVGAHLPGGWSRLLAAISPRPGALKPVHWPLVVPDGSQTQWLLPARALVGLRIVRHPQFGSDYGRQLTITLLIFWPGTRTFLPEELAELLLLEGTAEANIHRLAALFLTTGDPPFDADDLRRLLGRESFTRVAGALDPTFHAVAFIDDTSRFERWFRGERPAQKPTFDLPVAGGTTWSGRLVGHLTGDPTECLRWQFEAAVERFGELLYRARLRSLKDGLGIVQGAGADMPAVQGVLESLKTRFGADGVKLFGWQRGPEGPEIIHLFRTDSVQPRPRALDPATGLRDFALVSERAFIAQQIADVAAGPVQFALTSDDGSTLTRPGHNARDEGDADPWHLAIAPIRAAGRPRWAIGLWRTREHRAFSTDDLSALNTLASSLAPWSEAAERVRRKEQEQALHTRLVAELGGTDEHTFEQRARRLLAIFGQHVGAAAAVLLLQDERDGRRTGRFHFAAEWKHRSAEKVLMLTPSNFTVMADEEGRLAPERLATPGGRLLEVVSWDWAAIAFYSLPSAEKGWETLGSRPIEFSPETAQSASTLLRHTSELDAVAAIDQLLRKTAGVDRDAHEPDAVLSWAASTLIQSTTADVVFVYALQNNQLQVTRAVGRRNGGSVSFPFPVRVSEPSLTHEVAKTGKGIRILDVRDNTHPAVARLGRDFLQTIIDRLIHEGFWSRGVRVLSWMNLPILDHNQQVIGLLKALTGERTGFLTLWHERLATAITERAVRELEQVTRQSLLSTLNQTAEDLHAHVGKPELGRKMVEGLERWFRQVLPRDTVVVLVARGKIALATEPVTLVADASRDSRATAHLRALSADGHPPPGLRSDEDQLCEEGEFIGRRIGFRRTEAAGQLTGMLWISGERSDHMADFALREAAREMLLVLDAERTRRNWRLTTSRFRHALLGTLQGLQSNAGVIADRVSDELPDHSISVALQDSVRAIDQEVNNLQLWTGYSKLYDPETTQIDKGIHPLGDAVERCVERFTRLFERRRINLTTHFSEQSRELHWSFDPMVVDVVLTNLLDNALKYSFSRTSTRVLVSLHEGSVVIAVENIGAEVPPKLKFEPGMRFDKTDPFRTITGEGVGLALSNMLITAHGGELHFSNRLFRDSRQRPHRVRFWFNLPPGKLNEEADLLVG